MKKKFNINKAALGKVKQTYLFITLLLAFININAQQVGPYCDNGNFDASGITIGNCGWIFKAYDATTMSLTTPSPSISATTGTSYSYTDSRGTKYGWEIVSGGTDSYLQGAPRYHSGTSAIKLGTLDALASAESMGKWIADNQYSKMSFWYALVLEDPSHNDQPFFGVRVHTPTRVLFLPILPYMKGSSGVMNNAPIYSFFNSITPDYWVTSTRNIPGTSTPVDVVGKSWTCGNVDLSDFKDSTIFLEFIVGDCAWLGHAGYAYVDDICFGCNPDTGAIEITKLNKACGYYKDFHCGTTIVEGKYKLPQDDSFLYTLDTIKVMLYQNGSQVPDVNTITLLAGSTSIDRFNRKFSINTKDFGNLVNLPYEKYDIVAKMYARNHRFGSIKKNVYSSKDGFLPGMNNDWKCCCLSNDNIYSFNNGSPPCKITIKFDSTNYCSDIHKKDLQNFLDSFNFRNGFNYKPDSFLGKCYVLDKLDSMYDCQEDIKSYSIRYKTIINGKTNYLLINIKSDCDIASCENYVCKSNAGTILNPILNNLRSNFRPQEEKLYIVKREDNTTLSLRKGQTYSGFTPLYSFNPNTGWTTSTNSNWVTKDFVTNFDEKGNQIESKDPLNIYTSYKFGFNKSFVTSVAKNAKYKECINLSFEDEYFNVDPNTNYSNGFRKEFYLPKIGNGQPNSNTLNTYDQVYNISYADVVENVGHTGSNSYFVKPFYGFINNPNFSEKEPYVMKVSQLCGPNDPDYFASSYEVNANTVNSVENSYSPAFQLEKGKKYILSYWVKDAPDGQNQYFNYSDRGYIDIDYDCNAPTSVKSNINKSKPVEGWQRDFFEFEVPQNASLFKLIFMPNSNGTYFDDIRIFPSKGNMKTFIYDPITFRFTAELDENNFATFYDYDEQGQLIRVRKETERGIMTIKESRTSLKQE